MKIESLPHGEEVPTWLAVPIYMSDIEGEPEKASPLFRRYFARPEIIEHLKNRLSMGIMCIHVPPDEVPGQRYFALVVGREVDGCYCDHIAKKAVQELYTYAIHLELEKVGIVEFCKPEGDDAMWNIFKETILEEELDERFVTVAIKMS